MSDINKNQIKLMASQRLDDTDQGGGQMTSIEVVSGSVNGLFPDISRLDRVYGRVSIRKAYVAVQTSNRPTYYGSHAVLTKQADDPNVGVCFFTSSDWFDTRRAAKTRIESYLVKGPILPGALWGNHYLGSRQLQYHTNTDWDIPEIGDVIVLVENEGLNSQKLQFVRVIEVSSEIRSFWDASGEYKKKIVLMKIGETLKYDYTGEEMYARTTNYGTTSQETKMYVTVAADASRYYGMANLAEDCAAGDLRIRVDNINVPLVPSAQSETAITDAGVGMAVAPLLQTRTPAPNVSRSVSFSITTNSRLYIGEGVKPGTFSWTGGLTLADDGKGNILSGGNIIGSIHYPNGMITFGSPGGTWSGTGTATYVPASPPSLISESGGIEIAINNRGFSYTFSCSPLPMPGSLRVDFLSGGKWYSMRDLGTGEIKGLDSSIGSGVVSFLTGSVQVSFGAMPDVDSTVLFFWAKDAQFYDLSGETLPVTYAFTTQNSGVTRSTFLVTWNTDGTAIMDNGQGALVRAEKNVDVWEPTADVVGTIKYATGEVKFGIHASQVAPLPSESVQVVYSYGDKHNETFNPSRDGQGRVEFYLSNTPIKPGTFKVTWHTDQVEYDPSTRIHVHMDPTWIFQDDFSDGTFINDVDTGITNWVKGSVNHTTGRVYFMPDRRGTFPYPMYDWVATSYQNAAGQFLDIWSFTHMIYLDAGQIWPTEGIIEVDYCTTDGLNEDSYALQLDKRFYIKESSNLELVPGSVKVTLDGVYLMDIGTGKLFRDISGTTGMGTEVGDINYILRTVTITSNALTGKSLAVNFASGTAAIDPVQVIVFRTPGAPVRPGSVNVRGTLGTGAIVSGNSNFDGTISGDGIVGTINYNTGICKVSFGEYVTDDAEAQAQEWYNANLVEGGQVWKPYSVRASTIMINCVITSYLPLDPVLLGLDPVRLPLDGRVPIFRDGYIILVHHTIQEELPNPLVAETTYTLSRDNLDLIELFDSTGMYFPDGGNYEVDLDAGTVTTLSTMSTVNNPPFTPPFYALTRREDMCLASDVQITGHIGITAPLRHSYVAGEAQVSSVLPFGDLQSRAYNEFMQNSWTSVWSDDIIGSPPLANYDFVNYPITVYNSGATKERWLILFKTTTTIDVIGENLGVLMAGVSITSLPGGLLSVQNRLTGELYWTMYADGFGVGYQSGNCIRFNTDAANYPISFVRTTLQAPPTEPTDSYIFQIRGDSA